MTSKLVSSLLEREGLLPLLTMREEGRVPDATEAQSILARAEVLALGAAAQLVRFRECGDEAHIYVPSAPLETEGLVVISQSSAARGTALLRLVACLRLTGPKGLRIVVDFGSLGLEIAQVALSFGASDLAGPIASRRGLPMIDGEDQKSLVKKREMAAYVERAGLKPVFVSTQGPKAAERTAPDAPTTRPHVDT